MKLYRLPNPAALKKLPGAAIFFDMDSTLYTHDEYARTQIELPIERLARLREKSFEQMSGEITAYRKNWAAAHNGQTISLGNTFTAFGISIEENIRWREELYRPEHYLCEDKKLYYALEMLASRFTLAVVTNNPVSIAMRTLSVLGVENLFHGIVGLDSCGVSKPHKQPFCKAVELCGAVIKHCVSVGDRYDIDIALPLELGMGGVLVNGVEDVYKLPELFAISDLTDEKFN